LEPFVKGYRLLGNVAAVALFGLFSTPSHAILIGVSTSNPHNFSWSFDSQTSAGLLTGTGVITIGGFNSSSLTVAVTLNNTSTPTSDRLTAFGFGIDPNATSVTFADAADAGMINASLSQIPSLSTVEVCAFGGPNCSGGGNGGILGGASDSFQLVLAGTWGSSVNIDPIGFKYQTGVGSFEFTTDRPPPPPTTVPEPSMWALFSAGLVLLALGRLRRRRQPQ
jgi:hypothetical protein